MKRMTLLNVRDMLAELLETEQVYAGVLDSDLESCMGVFALKGGSRRLCIGGEQCTKTLEKRVTVIVHHTDAPSAAEARAEEVYEALAAVRRRRLGSFTVQYVQPAEPIDLGRDERGICEYAVEATIYYERNE